MKSCVPLIIVTLLLTVVPSCVENIEMVGDDSFYVVECLLTEGNQQNIRVSTKTAFPPLTDFEANISDLTSGGTQYEFFPYENNLFSGHIDFTPVPGHEYLLTIRIDSRTTLTAKTTFPTAAEMTYQPGNGAWDSPYCSLVRVQKKSPNPLWMWGTYLAPSSYDPQMSTSHTSEEIACDHPGTDSFNLIDRELSAYCSDGSGTYMHNKILRLDINEDKATFSVFSYSSSNYFLEYPERNELHAICVSEEFDRILRETAALNFIQGGGDLINNDADSWFEVYDHNNYYTNIQGGTGIFGAYVSCKMNRL